MTAPSQGSASDSLTQRAGPIAHRLMALARKARLVIGWERLWPVFAMMLVVVALFVTLSWLGLWLALPVWARVAGIGVFAFAFLACLVPLFRVPMPGWAEALARIDRDTGLAHRPATALTDALATNPSDPTTRALWDAHRARMLEAAGRLTVAAPRPLLADKDPWALRFAVLLCLAGAFFVAGPERQIRLLSAFDWQGQGTPSVAHRLDGWIDPPGYTQFAPIILDLRRPESGGQATASVRVPANSTVVIRSSGGAALAVTAIGAIEAREAMAAPAAPATAAAMAMVAAKGGEEKQWTVKGNGQLAVRRGDTALATVTITAIADEPPAIMLDEEPQTNARGSLTLSYSVTDDYGVTSAQALFANPVRNGKAIVGTRQPLVPPPQMTLTLPGGDNKTGEATTITDLSSHPWAGARVQMTLSARDDIGQQGTTAPVEMTLPQRNFNKPLARALVEQRRDLVLDPGSKPRIEEALHALLIAPERFTPEPGIYLGLRTATSRLKTARSDPQLLEVADYLWEIALQVEDGSLSDAEKALRQAQENLRQALERDASEDEIKSLTQDLRQALDRFLQEFAEKMLRNRDDQQTARQSPDGRTVTPEDLQSMLDRMEQMARQGAMADAQRLLDELRDILENLQQARPNGSMDPMARQMEQSLDELDRMTRDQQDVRDRTFREGQRQREDMRQRRQPGQQQQGRRQQQGQQGQQGEPGEQGQPGEQGEDGMEGQSGQGGEDQGMQGLGQRQEALRQQLENLKRRMREMGAGPEQGLDDAEEAMRQAEGAMGRGSDGEAVDAQGRALEGLRRGAQGMAQQMQQMQDGEPGNQQAGEQPGPGQPGNRRAQGTDREDDPLGRPTGPNHHNENSKVRRAGKGGPLEQRAREVMDELRRRLGDPTRSQDELDYLNRLLRSR